MENDTNYITFLFFSALIKEIFQNVEVTDEDFFTDKEFVLEQLAENHKRVIYLADHLKEKYLFISKNAPDIIGVSHLKKNIQGDTAYVEDFFPINQQRSLRFLMQVAYKKVSVALSQKEKLAISYTLTFDTSTEEGGQKFFLQKGKIIDINNNDYIPVESGSWVNISHWKNNPFQYIYLKSGEKNFFLRCDPAELQVSVIVLSKAQLKVLRSLTKGNNLDKVAKLMHLSIHTVQTHCKNMLLQTGFSSRIALLNFAIEAEII